MKKCNRCKKSKSLSEFFKDKSNLTDGRYSLCKACKRIGVYGWREENREKYNALAKAWRHKNPGNLYASEIKRRYKCSMEQYNQLLKSQDFKCAICFKEHNPAINRGRLYVDHCHDSKKIRGLLCSHCNVGIGCLRHDQKILARAAKYLLE